MKMTYIKKQLGCITFLREQNLYIVSLSLLSLKQIIIVYEACLLGYLTVDQKLGIIVCMEFEAIDFISRGGEYSHVSCSHEICNDAVAEFSRISPSVVQSFLISYKR